MKLFKTNNLQIITAFQEHGFRLPSELIVNRTKKLELSYCLLEYKL